MKFHYLILPAALAICSLSACATAPPASDKPAVTDADMAAQCEQLRIEINRGEVARREAASSSAFPVIAEAAEAREDQKVEQVRQRYAALGCGRAPRRIP